MFHFRLESLLRYRKSVEQRQEVLLREAYLRVAAIKRAISDVDRVLLERSLRQEEQAQAAAGQRGIAEQGRAGRRNGAGHDALLSGGRFPSRTPRAASDKTAQHLVVGPPATQGYNRAEMGCLMTEKERPSGQDNR